MFINKIAHLLFLSYFNVKAQIVVQNVLVIFTSFYDVENIKLFFNCLKYLVKWCGAKVK